MPELKAIAVKMEIADKNSEGESAKVSVWVGVWLHTAAAEISDKDGRDRGTGVGVWLPATMVTVVSAADLAAEGRTHLTATGCNNTVPGSTAGLNSVLQLGFKLCSILVTVSIYFLKYVYTCTDVSGLVINCTELNFLGFINN